MVRTFEGSLSGQGLSLAIVVSRFNRLVTERLLAGAQDALARHGVDQEKVDVGWAPGSMQRPLVARRAGARRVRPPAPGPAT